MTQRFGIDTSILVRLLTGEPELDFARCSRRLSRLIEDDGAEVFASNQVVGEAYVAVQHHYGVSKAASRAGLAQVLGSGMVAPLGGDAVMAALARAGGAGPLDRLIAADHAKAGLTTLTLDRKMARLADARLL